MEFYRASDLGSAWIAGFSSLQNDPHNAVTVTITEPLREDVGVRREIEQTLVDLHASGNTGFRTIQSMDTVASTIFPIDLYPAVGSAQHFFSEVVLSERIRSHSKARRWGTYIGRLVQYPSSTGAVNQLAIALERFRSHQVWRSLYEFPVEIPADATLGLIGDAQHDALRRGGPCLAHVSVTRRGDVLNMVALYRHQCYYAKAYGNFLGLARLLAFLSRESDLEVGELTVVTGHAEAEGPDRRGFLERVRGAAGAVTDVETVGRPFGIDSSDIDLPVESR